MIEIFLALTAGLVAGTITGLIPGVHVNLIALMLFASSAFFLQYTTPLVLVVFVVSMAITHTFLDFIPSCFLGAPDADTALSILPGHHLLLKGRGYEAVRLTLIGSFAALLLIIVIAPLFVLFLPKIYPFFKQYMAFILIAASLFLILKERKSKIWAFILFMLAGCLGIASLNMPLLKQPLFPLLTGLFGASLLVVSITRNVRLPEQKITSAEIKKKEVSKALGASLIASPLVSFLPGLGPGQAAVIGSEISGRLSRKGFLVLLGAINTLVMGLSFVALYAIGKPRTGAAVVTSKLLEMFTIKHLLLLLVVALVAGSIAVFLTIAFAKIFAKNIAKINYKRICMGILTFLALMTIFLSGWLGLLVLIVATAVGLVACFKGIRRMHLMGCLLLPVILWFL